MQSNSEDLGALRKRYKKTHITEKKMRNFVSDKEAYVSILTIDF